MISVGETLRRERLRRNLDLERISEELKISSKFLEAIEDEHFDRLPGGVFAKSFVRQYARLLELDEDDLAGEVQRMLHPVPASPQPAAEPGLPAAGIHLPRVDKWQGGVATERPFSFSSSLPALAGVVVVMLVCSGIYSWWQRSRRSASAHETLPPVEMAQPPQPAPLAAEPAPPATQSAALQSSAPVTERPQPRPLPGSPEKPLSSASGDRNSADRPAGEQTAPRAQSLRVEITAEEPVWVLAQNDGKYLFSGTLEANQTRTVEAGGTVTLRLGNAGGVNITFNGKPIGSVGPKGQVRTIQFTSGGFHIVAAPKPSLPLDEIP